MIEDKISNIKDVVFVAHEFGLYKGHGGIASYLYNICKWLVDNTRINVHVISPCVDSSCDLIRKENFKLHSIKGNIDQLRHEVFSICKEIKPQYVEFAEYSALGLFCTLKKASGQNEFVNTLLVTNNHTATRECYEWSSGLPIECASPAIVQASTWEKLQIQTSDVCIAPSTFLGQYVQKRYALKNKVLFFMNPFLKEIETKSQIRERIMSQYELKDYDDAFNISLITRFEGRKNQKSLVKSFCNILASSDKKINLILAGGTSSNPQTGIDYREEVWNTIPETFKDRIFIYDFLSLEQQNPIVAITDLTVMPSTFENQPMAMIEAVLRGIPVVASRYSGCADYLLPEMLFDPFIEDSLEQVIRYYINLPEEEQQKIITSQDRRLRALISPEVCILPRFNMTPNRIPDFTSLNLEEDYHE